MFLKMRLNRRIKKLTKELNSVYAELYKNSQDNQGLIVTTRNKEYLEAQKEIYLNDIKILKSLKGAL